MTILPSSLFSRGMIIIKQKIRGLILILSAVYLFCKICNFAERHFSINQNFVVGLFLLGVLVYALFKLGRSLFGGGVNGRDKEGR